MSDSSSSDDSEEFEKRIRARLEAKKATELDSSSSDSESETDEEEEGAKGDAVPTDTVDLFSLSSSDSSISWKKTDDPVKSRRESVREEDAKPTSHACNESHAATSVGGSNGSSPLDLTVEGCSSDQALGSNSLIRRDMVSCDGPATQTQGGNDEVPTIGTEVQTLTMLPSKSFGDTGEEPSALWLSDEDDFPTLDEEDFCELDRMVEERLSTSAPAARIRSAEADDKESTSRSTQKSSHLLDTSDTSSRHFKERSVAESSSPSLKVAASFLEKNGSSSVEASRNESMSLSKENESSGASDSQDALSKEAPDKATWVNESQFLLKDDLESKKAPTCVVTRPPASSGAHRDVALSSDPSHEEKPSLRKEEIDLDLDGMKPSDQQREEERDEDANAKGCEENPCGGEDVLEVAWPRPPEDRTFEVHPSYYVPEPYKPKSDPLVHRFTVANKPLATRSEISISRVFSCPIDSLWKNKFQNFNHMQSELTNKLAYSDDNVVVSAPTGAGKTAIFEMAIARFLSVDLQNQPFDRSQGRQISPRRKMVYIAPSKALCEERYTDWSIRLASMRLGLQVAMVTGDGDPSESFHSLATAHLVITTPEKFDSLTRRWTDNFVLFASFKLFLIDEVHLVADESRGCSLESVLCRMKSIRLAAKNRVIRPEEIAISSYPNTTSEALQSTTRSVAVSATLPNISDIASFLDANEAHTFDASYRPVPLRIEVVSLGIVGEESNRQFQFWNGLNRSVPELICRYSDGKPSIVFCHSKVDTEQLADLLTTARGIYATGNKNRDLAGQTNLTKLQRVLYRGIAYHHAGMDVDDRRLVEKAFLDGKIRVLCATSTLAMGVNLPAHLVIVKGTKAWRGGGQGYKDIDQASLLQMIGRAGRPGFDDSGVAVVMTDKYSRPVFQRLATSGLQPAKSQLKIKLDEIMNVEVSQAVVTSVESAVNWMTGSLYFVQLLKHQTDGPHAHLRELCQDSLTRLRQIGVVQISNNEVRPTPASHVMSQHMVDYQAMGMIVNLKFDCTQKVLLNLLSNVNGLQRPVRRSEKRHLNEAHKSIRYKLEGPPSKVRVKEPFQKVFVLLQCSIGQIALEEYTLRQEMNHMVEYSSRILSAIEEYSTRQSQHGQVAVESLLLRRSLATSLWNHRSGVLNQLMGLGPHTTAALMFNHISTFEDVLRRNEKEIERAAQRSSPFGQNLIDAVSRIMKSSLKVSAHLEYAYCSTTPCSVICHVQHRQGDSSGEAMEVISNSGVTYTLAVYTDNPGECLAFKKDISKPTKLKIDTPPKFGTITIALLSSLVGLDETIKLKGNDEPTRSASSTTAKRDGKGRVTKSAPGTARRGPLSRSTSGDPRSIISKRRNNTIKVTPSPKQPATLPEGGDVRTESRLPSTRHYAAGRGDVEQKLKNRTQGSFANSSHNPRSTSSLLNGDAAESVEHGDGTEEPKFPAERESFVATWASTRSPRTSAPWKRAKVEQQRSQQRAFKRKKDNPFRMFRHDPNDSESQLDKLANVRSSTSPQSSIIPPEGIRQLQNESERMTRSYNDRGAVLPSYRGLEGRRPLRPQPVQYPTRLGSQRESRPIRSTFPAQLTAGSQAQYGFGSKETFEGSRQFERNSLPPFNTQVWRASNGLPQPYPSVDAPPLSHRNLSVPLFYNRSNLESPGFQHREMFEHIQHQGIDASYDQVHGFHPAMPQPHVPNHQETSLHMREPFHETPLSANHSHYYQMNDSKGRLPSFDLPVSREATYIGAQMSGARDQGTERRLWRTTVDDMDQDEIDAFF